MFRALPPATRTLILINVAVSVLQQLAPDVMERMFALWSPGNVHFEPWQLITYAFLHAPWSHGGWTHLFFNMFALFMFGGALERLFGRRRFVVFYLVCALTAALTQLMVQAPAIAGEPVIGASGGVFGVLLAYAWYFPNQKLIVLPIPIPVSAWLLVTVYGLLELLFGVTGTMPGVAHFAHLGGMLGGALCILYFRSRRPVSG